MSKTAAVVLIVVGTEHQDAVKVDSGTDQQMEDQFTVS